MSTPPAAAAPRNSNLALAFQEVFTLVLRTRFRVQPVDSAHQMRTAASRLISDAGQRARELGYSKDITKMAVYAIVGFLDESVLNSRDPVFADWARRPLGEEIFGDMLAGERFFRDVVDLLNRPESWEVADMLELHCLCLLLGFRGKYAFENQSEIHVIQQRIRQKINRIRGPLTLTPASPAPPAPTPTSKDRVTPRLALATVSLAVLCLLAFLAYLLILNQGAVAISHNDGGTTPASVRTAIGQELPA